MMSEECLNIQAGTIAEKQWENNKWPEKKFSRPDQSKCHLIKGVIFVRAYQTHLLLRWFEHTHVCSNARECESCKFGFICYYCRCLKVISATFGCTSGHLLDVCVEHVRAFI